MTIKQLKKLKADIEKLNNGLGLEKSMMLNDTCWIIQGELCKKLKERSDKILLNRREKSA